ncbi:nSTAND3 domain-containing NTPase [Dyadobacter chenhuakuii]|uniref:Novel STAND NTPase 3 domain-containing protein n=1 Tax=Dyadobacter chenhuakuii TaxID=2909339 RepID=A0ABY4XIK4_9BACT|nr:hypothetical protein [Dyadobacter chenhuakuii]MCF2496121.1 hypothetical protein [Dyadobacter chenhuakuii]USJ30185.1 hypothetical protein NFI80_20260 [Dyadobacter chenhuakuii]
MLTTIIERYLLSIDQATFQKMMNHLLFLEGYKFISSPGSVVGKNKTSKGAPDSVFAESEGLFVFCEMTTQEKLAIGETFQKKLRNDILHCFNFGETSIANEHIAKVILAFNQKIEADEIQELNNLVKKYNSLSELVIYSIQEIPFRLLYYPGLADKYIPGVKTTQGTFYTLPDFLAISERGIQPALTNPFVAREAEIQEALAMLTSSDLLVLKGGQGVGKSKFAIHLAEHLEKEQEYEIRVIDSSPVPIWDDLQTFLLPEHKYVLIFDDANKALPNLDYLVQFVKRKQIGSIKILVTVRDYVSYQLEKSLINLSHQTISLFPQNESDLRKIIDKLIPDRIYISEEVIDRILSISKGNTRIAIMAITSILQKMDVGILSDIFSLYDQYFKNVRLDISTFEQSTKLQTLGILSFFGILDKNDESTRQILETKFNLSWKELWENLLDLERSEMVDIFNRETAKVSDQVLAVYAMYKTFVDSHTASIRYSTWTCEFLERFSYKVDRTIHDIINTFGYEELKPSLEGEILKMQQVVEFRNGDLHKFFDIFWFYREIDTLHFVKRWIDNLPDDTISSEAIKYDYEANEFMSAPAYISLLIKFWRTDTQYTSQAIDLGIKLVHKHPSRIPETLKFLVEHTSFKRYDYKREYVRQFSLFKCLSKPVSGRGQKEISDGIFLSAARSFLEGEYRENEGGPGGHFVIYTFKPVKTDKLIELRVLILVRLFSLFNHYSAKVLNMLNEYLRTLKHFDENISDKEKSLVDEFIDTNFSIDEYSHCALAITYKNVLTRHSKPVGNRFSKFEESEIFIFANEFKSLIRDSNLPALRRYDILKETIKKRTEGAGFELVESIIQNFHKICESSNILSDNNHWVNSGIYYLFDVLAETQPPSYYRSLHLMLTNSFSFEIEYGRLISYPLILKLLPHDQIFKLIDNRKYIRRDQMILSYYNFIDENNINELLLISYIDFLSSTTEKLYFYSFENLERFDKLYKSTSLLSDKNLATNPNIVTYVVEHLLIKLEKENLVFEGQICEFSTKYFSDRPDLLQEIFYYQQDHYPHYDHSGNEVRALMSIDNRFIIKLLDRLSRKELQNSYWLSDLDLSFVWSEPDYIQIVDSAIELIMKKYPLSLNFEGEAGIFFRIDNNIEELTNRVEGFISLFINKNHKSRKHIRLIFNVIAYQFRNKLPHYLKEFLTLNKEPKFLEVSWLEINGVFSGSRVPRIEAHIIFLKSLIELVKGLSDPLDYFEYIREWEREIEYSKRDKLRHMRSDFVERGE